MRKIKSNDKYQSYAEFKPTYPECENFIESKDNENNKY